MQDMLVKLYELPDYSQEERYLSEQGIIIRRPLAPEKHVLTSWIVEHFSLLWKDECELAFSHMPVSVFWAIREQEVLGFACYDTTARNFFGPTGVSPSARGKGIGKVLLWKALKAMRDHGFAYAIIGGVGPASFYEKQVGATLIPGSDPGIYRGLVKKS
ncbi:MAG: GNAT family N-acetyltransferase [Bacteroidota bacterium]